MTARLLADAQREYDAMPERERQARSHELEAALLATKHLPSPYGNHEIWLDAQHAIAWHTAAAAELRGERRAAA